MLYQILQAHGGTLPDDVVVCFANTGKEMPQTLDFVHACSENWNVPIVWLELGSARLTKSEGRKKFSYETRIVTHETASRNGEPFRSLVEARQYLPNPVARFCTADLKVRRINDYLKSLGWDEWETAVGIRADEQRRAAKILQGRSDSGEDKILPLYHAGVTKEDIFSFWTAQDFDLKLPNNNGTTDWGNCDLCFLKSAGKKLSIIREQPELVKWWAETEEIVGSTFRNDHPSYSRMVEVVEEQRTFDFDDSLSCFCGE